MQTTFLVELRFWVEGLGARHYENHVSRKQKVDKMDMTLRNVKMHRYIGSKTKSY